MSERTPLEVACPRCGAAIGRMCRTETGYRANIHANRWKAVGIDKPSANDRQRLWEEHQRLVGETIEARYANTKVPLTEI